MKCHIFYVTGSRVSVSKRFDLAPVSLDFRFGAAAAANGEKGQRRQE